MSYCVKTRILWGKRQSLYKPCIPVGFVVVGSFELTIVLNFSLSPTDTATFFFLKSYPS